MRRRVAAVAVGLIAVLLVDGGNTADGRRHRRTRLHDCGDPAQGAPPDGFTVALSLDRTTYERGRPVTLTLRVRNGSAETFTHEVGYPDAAFEIVTRDKVVWSSTWAQAYPAIAFEESFAPGEEKTATITWDQDLCRTGKNGIHGDPPFAPGPPPAGTYTAHASWRGRWSAPPVTFSIVR
jgi:hypothetical protein